jgi:Transcription termination factor nusG
VEKRISRVQSAVCSWFVVQTNPQRESFVTKRLNGLELYLPQFKNPKGRIAPVFPNYLFVRYFIQWAQICTTEGVRAILMSGEHPAQVPDATIRDWKAKERSGLVQLPDPPRFKTGARLIILSGMLRHREVIHAGMSGRDRERVLIEMLGQTVVLTVPSTDLCTAEEHRNLQKTRKPFIRQLHRAPHRAIA